MSTIVKTDAIVLKAMNYRESSKILTFFTREHGKIAGIMKGVRQSKTMYGNSLDPMAHVAIVMYDKKGRDIQLVTHCESVERRTKLFTDIDKMMLGLSIVEIVRDIAHEQEQNIPLFDLLTSTLSAIDSAERNVTNLLYWFEVRLSHVLGFTMIFDRCHVCDELLADENTGAHQRAENLKYDVERGAPICGNCSAGGSNQADVTIQTLRMLTFLDAAKSPTDALALKIDPIAGQRVESLIWWYLRFHVSGIRTLKSRALLSAITNKDQ